MKLEVWINETDKVVSFHPVPDWNSMKFESRERMQKQLDYFALMGFQFQ